MKHLRSAAEYQVLRDVRLQLRRNKGFLLIYLFGQNTLFFQWLKAELDQFLRAQAKRLKTLGCDTDADAEAALKTLLLADRGEERFAIWLDAAQGQWEPLLARLNERRSQLVANQRAVFICLPDAQQLHCATLAPDLWSIRHSVYQAPQTAPGVGHSDAASASAEPAHRGAAPTVSSVDYAKQWQQAWAKQQSSQGQVQASSELGLAAIEYLIRQRQLGQAQRVAEQVAQNLAATHPTSTVSAAHAWLEQMRGDIRGALGDLGAARASYEKSLAISEQLVQLNGQSPEALRDLSVSLNKVGNIRRALGDLDAARVSYEKSLAISEQLVQLTGQSPEALRDLSISLDKVGDIRRALGDLDAARASYEKSLAISEQLVQLTEQSPEALRDLSVSLNKVGNIRSALGDLDAARVSYEKSLAISEQLVQLTEQSPEALRDLSISLSKFGDSSSALRDLDAARASYEKSLAISEQLVQLTGQSPEALRDLSVSLNKVGNIRSALGDLDAARASYEKSLAIREQLVQLTGQAPEALRDLSISLEKVGDSRRALGDLDAARASYEKSLAIREQLVQLTGQAPEALRDLAVAYECLGDTALQAKDLLLAKQWFTQELVLGQRLMAFNPNYEQFSNIVHVAQAHLAVIAGERK